MAELNMKINAAVYGMRLAKAVGWTLYKLGASYETAHRWAMRCVLIRIRIGGKYKSWVWGGKRVTEGT